MNDRDISKKLRRLREGKPLRVVDLFAGCGGLSLGFHTAGMKIVAAVEIDPLAAASHARNFYPKLSPPHRTKHAQSRDITKVEPAELLAELGLRSHVHNAIDVLVGGPPCQAFARVGRAKLREVDEHPEAFRLDPRGNLYLRYLQYVREFKPLALLMENVPDVLNYGGHNISDEMCEVLDSEGYVSKYTLLNSAFYGVPQMRERMFLLAYRKELDVAVTFPKPTHWVELPPGYTGSRDVALKVLRRNGYGVGSLIDEECYYVEPPQAALSLPPAVTAEKALRDLPPITAHLEGKMRRGARHFTDFVAYRKDVEPSKYGRLMRQWPDFENREGVCDHVIRSLPRDYPIFGAMKHGDQYPEAHELALKMCERERVRLRIKENSREHRDLIKQIVPPYDHEKFPNKWRKMEPDKPARTLMAHIGKDTYSHIHYDSNQARTISVREAARLQSFPDGFIFDGTMNPAFRQIGNAVPPLMAFAIAREITRTIGHDLCPACPAPSFAEV